MNDPDEKAGNTTLRDALNRGNVLVLTECGLNTVTGAQEAEIWLVATYVNREGFLAYHAPMSEEPREYVPRF